MIFYGGFGPKGSKEDYILSCAARSSILLSHGTPVGMLSKLQLDTFFALLRNIGTLKLSQVRLGVPRVTWLVVAFKASLFQAHMVIFATTVLLVP